MTTLNKKITNKTNGSVICSSYELAGSMWKKAIGLMFRSDLSNGRGLLMTFPGGSSAGIWMLFMRFPIDILFLSSEKKVLKVVRSASPLGLSPKTWKIYFSPKPASFVLELPSGSSGKTKVGDELEF